MTSRAASPIWQRRHGHGPLRTAGVEQVVTGICISPDENRSIDGGTVAACAEAGLGREEYRVCIVAADGHVEQRIGFLAPNDQAALEYARHIADDDTEAWLEHVVAKLKPAVPAKRLTLLHGLRVWSGPRRDAALMMGWMSYFSNGLAESLPSASAAYPEPAGRGFTLWLYIAGRTRLAVAGD